MNDKLALEADGGEPMTKGTERLLVHPRSTEGQVRPEPTAYDWADNLELSHDRLLTLYQVDPDHCFHEPPKLLLEEFDSTRDLDNLEPGGSPGVALPGGPAESHRVAPAVAGRLSGLQGVRFEEVARSVLG